MNSLACELIFTHSDFASLVGLCDPNAALTQVSVLHSQLRLGFTHFPTAHVKSNNISPVPRHESTHTRGGMHNAAALPLTDVDLERPKAALIQDKGAYLGVVIVSVWCKNEKESSSFIMDNLKLNTD